MRLDLGTCLGGVALDPGTGRVGAALRLAHALATGGGGHAGEQQAEQNDEIQTSAEDRIMKMMDGSLVHASLLN